MAAKNDAADRNKARVMETPTDHHVTRGDDSEMVSYVGQATNIYSYRHHISDEGKRLDSRAIGSLTDPYDLEPQEEDVLFIAPPSGASGAPNCIGDCQVVNELGHWLGRLSLGTQEQSIVPSDNARSAQGENAVKQLDTDGRMSINNDKHSHKSIRRNQMIAQDLKAQHLRKSRIAGFGTQHLDNFHARTARTNRLKVKEARFRSLQRLTKEQAVVDGCVEFDGGMTGIEFDDEAGMEVQTSQKAGAIENGGLTEGEVQERVATEDGDVVLADADPVVTADEEDEVMIGSDVEAEMEVDSGGADSDGDGGIVVGEPMRLEADGPRLETTDTRTFDPMETEQQSAHATVNLENLHDRTRREKEEMALRQTSTTQTNSAEIVLGSGGDSAESSQQHATQVSTSETTNAATSILQGAAQNLNSTHTAAELEEARLRKRVESRMVPEGAASPSTSQRVSMTEVVESPESTPSISPSQSFQSTTTPVSTPTTASSSRPTTPPPANVASANGSPAPGTAVTTPKQQDRKRGSDPSDDGNEMRRGLGNQSMPAAAPSTLSATRRVLLAKTVKRKAHTSGPEASTVGHDQRRPLSEPSNVFQPETSLPAESSKRVQHGRRMDASDDTEIMPLNSFPDQTLTGRFLFFFVL